ncbi:MAG: histidine kinase, partial [Zetaproteobacteria bacterium CG_4_9_14_3_um_filter_53_7]
HAVHESAHPFIIIGLEHYEADRKFMTAHPEMSATAFAHLYVKDNGCGISETNLPRVTEPFFTTKAVGKGTGLGLPMVFGAVQSHEGILQIDSTEGHGTAVHIYLPLQSSSEQQVFEHKERNRVVRGNGETILLVDDDQSVLDVTREALESIGYRVIVASEGSQAVRVYSEHAMDIALVLMDVVMPKTGGVEAARQLRQINTQIRIVFMTGYDREQFSQDDALLAQNAVIQKPVHIETLATILAELIEQGR